MILLDQRLCIGVKSHHIAAVDLVYLSELFLFTFKKSALIKGDLVSDPLFHFGSCLICESQDQKSIDIDLVFSCQTIDSFGQYRRLATSGASRNNDIVSEPAEGFSLLVSPFLSHHLQPPLLSVHRQIFCNRCPDMGNSHRGCFCCHIS